MRNNTHLELNNILNDKIQAHPLTNWLKVQNKYYFDYQLQSFYAINKNKDTLINAPTGSGKTLAAFIAPIINLKDDIKIGLFTTLYISPLKSLIYDIKRNLEEPIKAANLNIRVETRTGDTTNHFKKRQLEKPPNFLITTPESFALLMSYENADKFFSSIRYIVIDELHTLMNSKRGDLLSLNLARLSTFSKRIVRIALSATIKDTKKALDYFAISKSKVCITPKINKNNSVSIIKSKSPIPWSGHMATYAIKEVYSLLKSRKSTIIFVNTRAQAEFIFQSLWKINKYNYNIAIHHGSLDKDLRLSIEKKMYLGEIDCIVATSSLELGLDWGNVNLVIQIGAPKGITRMIQRIGRSNHEIEKASEAILVPTNKFEYLECIAAIEAIKEQENERIIEKKGSLDVLAQHINGVACSTPFKADELYKDILKAYPYRDLKLQTFKKVLNFVHNGGYVLKNYNVFSRLDKNKDTFKITNKSFIRRYRMNLGTIVEAQTLPVYIKNKMLGNIEEYFITQLQKNDTFLFAGQVLKMIGISQRGVEVRQENAKNPKIPSYVGGNLPLSTFLAKKVIKLISNYNNYDLPTQIQRWLLIQKKQSKLPPEDGMLVETFNRSKNNYIVCYTFQGRSVNQTLGILMMQKLAIKKCQPLAFVATDYAVAVWSLKKFENINSLFNLKLLKKDLSKWLKNTSILKKHFKTIAIISGLIDRNLPGKLRSHRQINFNSDLIYDVLEKYEKNHILIKACEDEAFKDLIKLNKIENFISAIKTKILHKELIKISPFAVPVIMEFYTERISNEKIISYEEENIEHILVSEAYGTE